MKKKQIFDYKEPFHAPYMVRELTKNVKLPVAMHAQTIGVCIATLFITGFIVIPLLGVNQISVALMGLTSYGMVELFNRVEPDGKKVHTFLKDYFLYLIQFQLPNYQIYHGEKIKLEDKKIVYQSLQIKKIKLKE